MEFEITKTIEFRKPHLVSRVVLPSLLADVGERIVVSLPNN
jgi:hypothetical protein